MKFGAKYEILKTLAREDVEIFSVRKKTSGEELVAYIFACAGAPQNQPTAQWILSNFVRMAPDAPGNVLDAGQYDVANFAYVIMSMPPSHVLEAWIHQYQNEGDSPPVSGSADPEVVTAVRKPPADTSEFVAEVVREASSPPHSPPPDKNDSSQPAVAEDDSQRQTPVEGFGAQPREHGDFTRQFFREVAQPDVPRVNGAVRPAEAGKSEPQPENRSVWPASSEGPKAPDTSPNFAMGFEQASIASNAPGIDESAESQPGRISTGEFSRFFQVPSERREAAAKEYDQSPAEPTVESGGFTKIFGSEVPRAAGPSVKEPAVHQSSNSPQGSSTEILNNIPARGSAPAAESGGFTELFRPDVPVPPNDSDFEKPAFAGSSTAMQGSSTELFGRDSGIHESKQDVDYSFETKATHQEMDGGSSTQIFGDSGTFSSSSRAGDQFTGPGTSPSSTVPGFQNFDASSGGATVVFRATSERPSGVNSESAGGHSPYSVFMSREDLAGLQSADEASAPSASSAGGGGAAAAASASPFITPPAVPAYQPPPVPAFPPAPAMPGGAMPGMPPIAPPAVAAPKPQAQPPSPKSYWPLIITLNVLFIVAVLLIIYFALKH